MSYLQTFQVFPNLPEPLSFLYKLSRNLWWCWQKDAVELFRRIEPKQWELSGNNPIVFSTQVSQKRLAELAEDSSFLAQMNKIQTRFDREVLDAKKGYEFVFGNKGVIAYFSMEFGLHVSLPLFAGGLGVLAGDHLKSASDMNIPLVGVGLMYRQGYFQQYLNQEGWQQEEYPETDLFQMPVRRAKTTNNEDCIVSLESPMGQVFISVWEVRVGRIPLYLLDTNLKENSQDVRKITGRLYEGDSRIRLAQEMVLGIGGMRALAALGVDPLVCHMNEGHSAFSSLERLAQTMETENIDLKTALQVVPRTTVFTTHTPVSAGHDEFPADMVLPYIHPLEKRLDATAEHILSFGQPRGSDKNAPLSMFILGLRMAEYCNGVSHLHGHVARRMWSSVWPGRPEEEVPISHVTNGVHSATWVASENATLFERYLGPDWHLQSRNKQLVDRIDEIYDEELWRAHEMSRSRLIRTCRQYMVHQYGRRNAPKSAMEAAETVLDQDVLTIAFARRFASYKRAHLLLNDPERLKALLHSETRPVQIIFAGKAHPKDHDGKVLIHQLFQFIQKEGLSHRMVFLENYDMYLGMQLVQGADIWLNTPRRPLEACGTSGMKAALNGVLNVSILDGWWCEGYSEHRGWRIGNGEEYHDPAYQDAVESQALYNVLENDVIPCFYERKGGDAPERWIRMMKESMKISLLQFSGRRMVEEYAKRFYLPAARSKKDLLKNEAAEAKRFVSQLERLRSEWQHLRIEPPNRAQEGPFRIGESIHVTTRVHLGKLRPEDVDVELYYGIVKSFESLSGSKAALMSVEKELGDGDYLYRGEFACEHAGRFGFTARIMPRADFWIQNRPGFITWAEQ